MARIRTIKPDFFTSDDICALSPLARLLYIGLWCEADREGRLVWAPRVLRRRYLPEDDCDIEALCRELLERELVVLYREGLAWLPTFLKHQHVNPREAQSTLPPPPVSDASVTHTEERKGEEGKGKERKGREGASHAHPLPEDWQPGEQDVAWAASARPDLTPALLAEQTERFCNHARAKDRRLVAWGAAWRNWIGEARRVEAPAGASRAPSATTTLEQDSQEQWRARLRGYRPGRFWLGDWGPRPESGRSIVPADILADWKAAQCREEPHAHAPAAPAHPGAD